MTQKKDPLPPGCYGPEIQPFGTNDAILAFCLRIAGLPFMDERMPLQNIYDVEILKNIPGIDVHGMTLEAAVELAFAKKKKGHIRYLFKQAAELGGLLKAFEDEKNILTERKGDVAERVMELTTAMAAGDMDQHECVLRAACDILTARTEFNGMWKKLSPLIRVFNEGEVKIRDTAKGKVATHPGFKLMSLNASKETRKHLKL